MHPVKTTNLMIWIKPNPPPNALHTVCVLIYKDARGDVPCLPG